MADLTPIPPPTVNVERLAYRDGAFAAGARVVPAETAVAFTYDRMTHAVMMATPADLEDFAVGFSLAEGIVRAPGDIGAIQIVSTELGIELRMDLAEARRDVFAERRRHMTGPSGCGLCGIESLQEAMRALPKVADGLTLYPAQIAAAREALGAAQQLNKSARAIHAAAFWQPGGGLVALREDVGRHNALDKLAGALARQGTAPSSGLVLLTSRVSIELVQKVAIMGAPVMVAVSAPTQLAIRLAQEAGITLIGVAREDGFEIFTRPERILQRVADHVA
ncbi:MAG TPA: formate dehydrogenase accessory sulfurtransferase FdhD, partial [Stellaceae bacterium]|nr:formate dehydrogenase accessory sulfurtransferase FdhD [Stellaceae bacterium]